jgi:hypothetical protein
MWAAPMDQPCIFMILPNGRHLRKHSEARHHPSEELLGGCDHLDPTGKGSGQRNR